MKPQTLKRIGAAALLAGSCTTFNHAAILQWDADAVTAGAQDGGGTWDAAATNWINGGNVAWTDGNDAVFGVAAGSSHEVALAISPSVLSIAFNQPGYLLTAAFPTTITVTKPSTSGVAVTVGAGAATVIGSGVTLTTPALNQSAIIGGTGTLIVENGGTIKGGGALNTNILSINQTNVEVRTGGLITTTPMSKGATALFVNGAVSVTGGSLSIPGTLGIGQATGTTSGTLTLSEGTITANSDNGIRIGATSGTTQGGTVNLNGGTTSTLRIFRGGTGVAQSILNLNGGILRKGVENATYGQVFIDVARVNVRDRGAIIDTNGFTANINSALEHSNIGGDAATDGGLVKNGAGLLVLNGANTYNGGTAINGGSLYFASGAVPATGTITIGSAGALAAAGGFPSVGSILSSGKLNPASSGAIALAADSSEDINFQSFPALMLGASATAIHTGSITPVGGIYRLGGGGGNLLLPNADALTGANHLVVGSAGTTGTVILANSNNYTGSTTINGGTLQIGDGFSDGSIDASSGIVNNSVLSYYVVGTVTPPQTITGTGSLVKRGAGTLVLDQANTYQGNTTISGGVLRASHSDAFGTSPLITVNGSNQQLQLDGGVTIANAVRVNGGGLSNTDGIIKNTSGFNTLSNFGFAGVNGSRVHVLEGSSLSFPNPFAAGNHSSFRVIGGGAAILAGDNTGAIGASNSFILGDGTSPGPTVRASNNLALGAGTVQITGFSTLQSHGAADLVFANSLLFSDATATLGAAGTGSLTFNGPATIGNSLELTVNNSRTTLAGPIASAGGDPKNLTKLGLGTLAIGEASFSGSVTVAAGELHAAGTVNIASGMQVLENARLSGNGSISSSITVNDGGIISPGASVGTLNATGSVTLIGDLEIELDGASADELKVTGTLDITSATLRIATLAGGAAKASYVIASFGTLAGTEFASVEGLPVGYAVQYDLENREIKLVSGAPAGFSSWIAGFTLSDPAAAADPDGDGLGNAVEYALGSDPSQAGHGGGLSSSSNGSNLILEFQRVDSSETPDVRLAVEAGIDLQSWPASFLIGADDAGSSAGVLILENGDAADTIRVSIPKGSDTRKFARLKATVNP